MVAAVFFESDFSLWNFWCRDSYQQWWRPAWAITTVRTAIPSVAFKINGW